MNDNPYQSSHTAHETNSVGGRPLWIYLYTIASSLVTASLPIVLGGFIGRYYRLLFPNSVSTIFYISILSLAAMAGAIAGNRVWRRLSRVHTLRVKLQRRRESALEEYSQLARQRNEQQ